MIKTNSLDLYTRLKSNMDDRCDATKFLASISADTPKELETLDSNLDFLEENKIHLTKPREWIVLDFEAEELKAKVLKATDLGFVDAYIQNPTFLKADVNEVFRRMAHLQSLGIPYKSENGKYLSWLFSKRATDYVISETNTENNTPSNRLTDEEILDLSSGIISMLQVNPNQEEWIKYRVNDLNKKGLDLKDILVQIFSVYCYNDQDKLTMLYSTINELVDNYSNEVRRAA